METLEKLLDTQLKEMEIMKLYENSRSDPDDSSKSQRVTESPSAQAEEEEEEEEASENTGSDEGECLLVFFM